jgi:hypothetical protein
MATNGNDKRRDRSADDPQWDRKQGTPRNREVAKKVEHASGRYSASDQSEERAVTSAGTAEREASQTPHPPGHRPSSR